MSQVLNSSKVKKILVVSLSNLGDIILTIPVLTSLRQAFPDAHLSVVVGPKGEELLRGSKMIDDVIIYDKKNMTIVEKLKWVVELKNRQFDLVVDLRNTLIPFIVGAQYRSRIWFREEPVLMRDKHLLRLKSLGIECHTGTFDYFSDEEKSSAYQKSIALGLQPDHQVVVIAPGAGSYLKRWRIDGFVEVAQRLFREDRQILIVGSASEKILGDQIAERAKVLNLCGALTLRELAAFLSDAALIVSNDSAIMHLGNELNIATVSIFGPTNDNKYAKRGSRNSVVRKKLDCTPCEKAHCRFERQACMEDLQASDVITACETLLS